MSESFTSLLGRVAARRGPRPRRDDRGDERTSCRARPTRAQIGLFLTALAAKGETAEEVAGAAAAMRAHMTPIRSRHARLLDTCGTGGGGSELFNVSTTAALVIAAAGVPVAKHGNRSVTSRSGSADVLAELGVNIDADIPQVERCLDELGVCFCFAPRMHPAMRHVAAVRKKLGIRTIFNILGPLSNPAGASHQLLGAGRPELRPLLASSLRLLGVERALVVSGERRPRRSDARRRHARHAKSPPAASASVTFTPEAVRPRARRRSIRSASPAPPKAPAIVRQRARRRARAGARHRRAQRRGGLDGVRRRQSPRKTPPQRAAAAIDSGAARDLLDRLVELSHAD